MIHDMGKWYMLRNQMIHGDMIHDAVRNDTKWNMIHNAMRNDTCWEIMMGLEMMIRNEVTKKINI